MKHLLITGGTSGLGLNYLERFGSNYDRVTVLGRNFAAVSKLGLCCDKIEVDFLESSSDFGFVRDLSEITNIIFAAGFVENVPLKFHDSLSVVRQINVNLISQINLFGELYSANRIARNSTVVFIGSLLGPQIGMVAGTGYAASKAGLVGAVKVLALEASKRNIRVNAVSPGMVETPMTHNLVLSQKLIEDDKSRYPLGKKYLSMEEVTDVVEFLLSRESSSITGQNVVADRGFTLQ